MPKPAATSSTRLTAIPTAPARIVGEFIASDRDHFVLATKYSLFTRHGDPNAAGNQRKNMVQSLEASLKRLNTDYIDLYWVHAWDFMTPVEEVMRALDDLVRAGKILYVGISDTPAWIVSRANMLAELRGWTPFVGLQIRYSLIDRAVERDLLPMARTLDIAVTPWGALGTGILSGKYNREGGSGRVSTWGPIDPKKLAIAEEVIKIADRNRPHAGAGCLELGAPTAGRDHSHRRRQDLAAGSRQSRLSRFQIIR